MVEKYGLKGSENYPFVTRTLIDLFSKNELPRVRNITIEPVYGYVGRIEYITGTVHIFRGTNLGVNPLGASEVAKDKEYTKFFLRQLGYRTPRGEVFLHPEYLDRISKNISPNAFQNAKSMDCTQEVVGALIGYPCYVKPNSSSQGRGIRRCENESDIEMVIQELKDLKTNVCIIEEDVAMPDYRVVIFNQDIISCYRRIPLSVEGDGIADIKTLLQRKQRLYESQGRDTCIAIDDPRIIHNLLKKRLSLESVLQKREHFPLLEISNLSAGGESLDYSDRIHAFWKQLCIAVTRDMGLKLCGVDIACSDPEDPSANYSILEINAAPGLDHYAASGEEQAEIVRSLYQRIFNNLDE